jgi:hypothetical protein
MEKIAKKVLGVALVCLVLVGVVGPSVVVPPVVNATEAALPRDPNGGIFPTADFIGVRKYLLNNTASTTEIVDDDQGLLYGICRMSATLGDYVVAFDYHTGDSLTALIPGMSTAHDTYIMSPYVYTDEEPTSTYTQAESVRGCWFPPRPIRFENGLVGKNSSAAGYSLFFFRTDAGGNPY